MPYFSIRKKNNIPVAIQYKSSYKTKPETPFLVSELGDDAGQIVVDAGYLSGCRTGTPACLL